MSVDLDLNLSMDEEEFRARHALGKDEDEIAPAQVVEDLGLAETTTEPAAPISPFPYPGAIKRPLLSLQKTIFIKMPKNYVK